MTYVGTTSLSAGRKFARNFREYANGRFAAR
jgi:hypothetical protein